MDPNPCKLENREADEMKVDGTVEMQHRVPSPCRLEKSCELETNVDGTEDK